MNNKIIKMLKKIGWTKELIEHFFICKKQFKIIALDKLFIDKEDYLKYYGSNQLFL